MEEFDAEVEVWLPLLPEVELPPLTGDDLLQVWMVGYGGSSSPCLFFDLMDFTKVELGVWPEVLSDAKTALIPKVGGDSTPLVLPVVCRIFGLLLAWCSLRVVQILGSWWSEFCGRHGRMKEQNKERTNGITKGQTNQGEREEE